MISEDLLLLKIIEVKGGLRSLIDRGLTHSQIANMIQFQIECGNIEFEGYNLKLTSKGKEYLKEGFKEARLKPKDTWILPQEHHYIKPISQNEIVLPKKI